MAITSQLPPSLIPTRTAALQALALQAGQVLDGLVMGPAPNGGTQVQIAGQMLNLVLPTLFPAGAKIRFEVQGSGAQAKLALQLPLQTGDSAPTAQPLPQPPQFSAQAAVVPLPAAPAASGQTVVATVATQGQPALSSGSTVAPIAPPQGPGILAGSAPLPIPPVASATIAAPAPAIPIVSTSNAPLETTTKPQPVVAPPLTLGNVPATPGNAPAAPANIRLPNLYPPPVSTSAMRVDTPMPLTPQAALSEMVQAALPRQDSVANLMTALVSVVGKTGLPEPVLRAAQQVLSGRVPLDGGKLDGGALQKAVLSSGLFQEANLSQGQVAAAQGDQKTALLALRQVLTNWLGPQPALAATAQMAPPIKGQVPRARASEPAPIALTATPEEVGGQLLDNTEGALSRLRLHQNASLPDPVVKTAADWSFDLPVTIGTQQSVLHLQIHREPEGKADAPAQRGWQMRFALSMPDMGEVGAQVSLRGGATGVMLWATRRETSDALESHLVALRQSLAEVGLQPGAVIVRHGEPPTPQPASGHFLDART